MPCVWRAPDRHQLGIAMSREGTMADVKPDLKLHERLDEIAEQTRIVAEALQERVIAPTKGEISTEELEGVRQAVEVLVHAWELEADLLRRSPR